MPGPALHIALYQPEIPPNTGNVGRLCLGLELRLHVVHPIGFSMDAKAVRRAGLDYWKHVDLMEHADGDAFWSWAQGRRVHVFSTRATSSYAAATYQEGDVLLFGGESKGVPAGVLERGMGRRIPMSGRIRSLNLSNAVAVATYHAMGQVRPGLFADATQP
jgi:tRNA (cytidine/uridine-2'-O-)-methyltransferase